MTHDHEANYEATCERCARAMQALAEAKEWLIAPDVHAAIRRGEEPRVAAAESYVPPIGTSVKVTVVPWLDAGTIMAAPVPVATPQVQLTTTIDIAPFLVRSKLAVEDLTAAMHRFSAAMLDSAGAMRRMFDVLAKRRHRTGHRHRGTIGWDRRYYTRPPRRNPC
jgi:hypothetical protein